MHFVPNGHASVVGMNGVVHSHVNMPPPLSPCPPLPPPVDARIPNFRLKCETVDQVQVLDHPLRHPGTPTRRSKNSMPIPNESRSSNLEHDYDTVGPLPSDTMGGVGEATGFGGGVGGTAFGGDSSFHVQNRSRGQVGALSVSQAFSSFVGNIYFRQSTR